MWYWSSSFLLSSFITSVTSEQNKEVVVSSLTSSHFSITPLTTWSCISECHHRLGGKHTHTFSKTCSLIIISSVLFLSFYIISPSVSRVQTNYDSRDVRSKNKLAQCQKNVHSGTTGFTWINLRHSCTVVWWLALLLHSKKVAGSNLGRGLSGVCMFSLCLRRFPPSTPLPCAASSQRHACQVSWWF